MEAWSRRREYSKLLMVPTDGDRGMSQFSFTRSPVATWKKIIDDLMDLGYEFTIYNKSTKRIVLHQWKTDSDSNKYLSRCVEKIDEFEIGGNNSMDIFMFQASWKRAFIYQARLLNDLDQYWLFFDESDCFPTQGYEPVWFS